AGGDESGAAHGRADAPARRGAVLVGDADARQPVVGQLEVAVLGDDIERIVVVALGAYPGGDALDLFAVLLVQLGHEDHPGGVAIEGPVVSGVVLQVDLQGGDEVVDLGGEQRTVLEPALARIPFDVQERPPLRLSAIGACAAGTGSAPTAERREQRYKQQQQTDDRTSWCAPHRPPLLRVSEYHFAQRPATAECGSAAALWGELGGGGCRRHRSAFRVSRSCRP